MNHENIGITKATKAAKSIGGFIATPDFGDNRPEKAADFDDLHQLEGAEAVARCIEDAVSVSPDPSPEAGSPFPAIAGRPSYVVLDEWTKSGSRSYRPGVYYCGVTNGTKGEKPTPINQWFCSPLHIDALTHDGQDNNFGRMLRFKPTVGNWREWAMPMELLAGDATQLRGELLSMGVELDYEKAKTALPRYLQHKCPERKVQCALQIGWCGNSFVLPDVVIGPRAKDVIFQSGERHLQEHTQAGTLEGWQQSIAKKAVGNPLLMLAVSASFVGPLLARCNAESGGIHFVGDSSTGKSTAMEAACATWGGGSFKRSWRATGNGLEGAAAMFNDCLLALDEISECDPREVGEIVYMLGNGRGKQRAGRTGRARAVVTWRCFVMSNGERSIATTMAEGGHQVKAGQSMRLLDIPVAQTYGAWDDLHGATSGAAFSDEIKLAAKHNHGYAGRAFLEKLAFDDTDHSAALEQIKASSEFNISSHVGQKQRAAARFALIGMAGEIATDYGVTGWQEGEAHKAAAYAFKLWNSAQGEGNDERRKILQLISAFIERHGDGRFSDIADLDDSTLRDRAGWWEDMLEQRRYLFTAGGMREATIGVDFNRALAVLQEAGALPMPGANGERARTRKVHKNSVKLYSIDPAKLID